MMAVSANAGTISYTTNSAGTGFVAGGTGLILNSTGVAGTLTFAANTTSNTGVPSNIDLGDFDYGLPDLHDKPDYDFRRVHVRPGRRRHHRQRHRGVCRYFDRWYDLEQQQHGSD